MKFFTVLMLLMVSFSVNAYQRPSYEGFRYNDIITKTQTSRFWPQALENVRGFAKILPEGSTLQFKNDILIKVNENRSYGRGAPGSFSSPSTGPNGNRKYYLQCRIFLTDSKETRTIKAGKPFVIKTVSYGFERNFLGDYNSLRFLYIQFDHPELLSMTCSDSDDFTGFDYQELTPTEFVKKMSPFFYNENFEKPLAREI